MIAIQGKLIEVRENQVVRRIDWNACTPYVSRIAAFVAYSGLLLAMLDRRPFWLDEILQLIGTVQPTLPKVLESVRANRGGVPLGYFVQSFTIKWLGVSEFAARLPSAVFSMLACAFLLPTARRLLGHSCVIVLLIFSLMPIQMHYASEARPYSQALLTAVLSTLAFLRLSTDPSVWNALIYAGAVVAGLYSQPFTVFCVAAQVLALAVWPDSGNLLRFRLNAIAASFVAGLCFLPWWLAQKADWISALASSEPGFDLSQIRPLLLLKEISGAGYVGSVVLLGVSIIGLNSTALGRHYKILLILSMTIPIVGAIAADAHSNYFFSIRQIVFIIPSLSLLAAQGFHELIDRRRTAWAIALGLVLLGSFVVGDVSVFAKHRENWRTASREIVSRLDATTCVYVIPEDWTDWTDVYAFFEPSVDIRRCTNRAAGSFSRVILVTTPYTRSTDPQVWRARLERLGFEAQQEEIEVGKSRILIMKQRHDKPQLG